MVAVNKDRIEQENYNAIDVFKFFCVILVVMIHIPPFGNKTENALYLFMNYGITQCIARIAVPFFFICSGYFLFSKMTMQQIDKYSIKRYLRRMLRIYLLWSIIYMPLSIRGIMAVEKNILLVVLRYLRDILFVGSYTHLWYLNATIVGVSILAYLLNRKTKIWKILVTGGILYIIGLFTESWYGIRPMQGYFDVFWNLIDKIEMLFVTFRNGFFFGFFFIAIGMFFAFYEVKIPVRMAIMGIVICTICLFVEAYGLEALNIAKGHNMYISLVPFCFLLFYLLQKIKLRNRKGYKIIRTISALIFYIHFGVLLVVESIIGRYCVQWLGTGKVFLVTLVLCVIIAVIFVRISEYKYFRFLKLFY